MNTVQKNFTLTEGARSRITVRLPEDVDPNNYEVYAGNDRCKCRHLVYGDPSVGEHSISLISEPAPQGCPIPYQIFIKDKSTDVEWLVVSGQVTVLNRYIGIPGISTEQFTAPIDGHDMEVEAPVAEETIEINVEVTYTKEDLDEAVRQAREAADRAYAWAEGDPGSDGYSAFHWASVAEQTVQGITAKVTEACNAANAARNAAGAAESSVIQANMAKTSACAAAGRSAQAVQITSTFARCATNQAHLACGYATTASTKATCAYNWAACAMNQAGAASASAVTAHTWACSAIIAANDASNSAGAACDFASDASGHATLAGQYANCAQHYVRDACNYANSAASSAQSACDYMQTACSAASTSCSAARVAGEASCQAACYMHKTCAYLDEVTGIAATKQDLLTWDELPTENSDNPVRSSGVYLLTNFPEYGDDRWHPGADCGIPQNYLYQAEVCSGDDLDLSTLAVCKLATAELWLDYHSGNVIWPSNWYWIDAVNDEYCYPPMRCCMVADTRYAISARNDGTKTVANVQYHYPLY